MYKKEQHIKNTEKEEFLETLNTFSFVKVCHEIVYTVNGICPHCDKEIKTEKIETFQDHFDRMENYKKFLEEWKNKKEKNLCVISQIKHVMSLMISGTCPYCNEFIQSTRESNISIDNPVYIDSLSETKKISSIIKCPKCNDIIRAIGFMDKDLEKTYYIFCTSEDYKKI